MHAAISHGYTVTGTYQSKESPGCQKFDISDRKTWKILENDYDKFIWAAAPKSTQENTDSFTELLIKRKGKKVVYVSSDITRCQNALKAETPLGDYARQKLAEHELVLKNPSSVVFITGPIYGINSSGTIDKRSANLVQNPNKKREFWKNVYKTFVPIDGLASTIFSNLDKTGKYYIGPPEKLSFYDFYKSRAESLGLPTNNFKPATISDQELAPLGQCRDISYSRKPNRLWEASA